MLYHLGLSSQQYKTVFIPINTLKCKKHCAAQLESNTHLLALWSHPKARYQLIYTMDSKPDSDYLVRP